VFALDRAGITGDDGPSHHGVYDMALLTKVPGMTVLAPSSAQELQQMMHDAVSIADSGPVAIRYARGSAAQVGEHDVGTGLLARQVRQGDGSVCVLGIGKLLNNAVKAAQTLEAEGLSVTVWDVRCCAPLDDRMIADAARHDHVITVEDGVREGGVGMSIADRIHEIADVHVESLGIPTRFVPAGKAERILAGLGLDADGISNAIRAAAAR